MTTSDLLRALRAHHEVHCGPCRGALHVLSWDGSSGRGFEFTDPPPGDTDAILGLRFWTVESTEPGVIVLRTGGRSLPLYTLDQARQFSPTIFDPLDLDINEPEDVLPQLRETTPPSSTPSEAVVAAPESDAEADPRLRQRHRRLLDKATRTLQPASALARAAGFKLSRGKATDYVYRALSDLVDWGYLRHAHRSYGLT